MRVEIIYEENNPKERTEDGELKDNWETYNALVPYEELDARKAELEARVCEFTGNKRVRKLKVGDTFPDEVTMDQRVAALESGIWDVLPLVATLATQSRMPQGLLEFCTTQMIIENTTHTIDEVPKQWRGEVANALDDFTKSQHKGLLIYQGANGGDSADGKTYFKQHTSGTSKTRRDGIPCKLG